MMQKLGKNTQISPQTPVDVATLLSVNGADVTWFPSYEVDEKTKKTFNTSHKQPIHGVVSFNDQCFATLGAQGSLSIWNEGSVSPICTVTSQNTLCAVASTSTGFLTADQTGCIRGWTFNGKSAKKQYKLQLPDVNGPVKATLFGWGEGDFACVLHSGLIAFGQQQRLIKTTQLAEPVKEAHFDSIDQQLLVCTEQSIYKFDVATGESRGKLPAVQNVTNYAYFAPHFLMGYDKNDVQTTVRIDLESGSVDRQKATFECAMKTPMIEKPVAIVPVSYQHAALVSSAQVKILNVHRNVIVHVDDSSHQTIHRLDHGQLAYVGKNDSGVTIVHRQPSVVQLDEQALLPNNADVEFEGQSCQVFGQFNDGEKSAELLTQLLVKRGFICRAFEHHVDIAPVPENQQDELKALVQALAK